MPIKHMDVDEYLRENYPRISDEFVIEQRDCAFSHWNLYGTCTFWEEAKRVTDTSPSQATVRRALHRRLSYAYYPTHTFDRGTDNLYTPVYWRGEWSDNERSAVFDLLQACDPHLYPLDVYQKWRIRHKRNQYSAWRSLFQRHISNDFDDLLRRLRRHYGKEPVS